ncbi:MAG: cellulase family glycosylhydrolase [Alphaproteobacteria bacterium]|nr:cellulase family glycosylhydrolase [Alphaproteobacteria bacterium]
MRLRSARLASALLACGVLVASAWAQPPRAITANMADVLGPRDMAWQDCVGADHGGLLFREPNRQQLRLVHDEIGFKYIRFHGIFADDTAPYREVDGKPVYDFSKVEAVYDAVLKAGMKPMIEVSFMPRDLASSDKTIFYWKAIGSPPKDWGKWSDFITAFTRDLENRFGKDEVESWRFEVWNEPNLDGFWTGGDQPSYFKLYDTTARAIKGVDPALKVGGPSTAGAAWVPDFLAYARSNGVPVDFVTTHSYGVQGGLLDENGEGDNKLVADPGSIVNDVMKVRREITASPERGLPLYFTEWSTSYNPRDPIHDAYLSAPFILEKLRKVDGAVQSMSYWTYTDLFEEAGPPPTTFHGGFGLLTREGIRKASYFAYKYLNELGPTVLKNADAESWLTRDGKNFVGLIWNYTTPVMNESNRPYFRKLHPATALPPVRLVVSSLAPGAYRLTLHRTGYQANDAYSQYIRWGLPKDTTPAQIAALQNLAADRPETQVSVKVGRDGVFRRTIPIRTNDVLLVRLEKVAN